MKLPIPSFLSKKEATNHFLALLIRDEKASAVIFKEDSGTISVVGKHEEYFPTSVEHADLEEILDTLDRTISRAEETLPPNVETEKTIFGLKETWVEDGKITKDYLSKLKKVSDELKLSPVGFLVISEALSKLIEEEEGAPLSAIISEIGKNNVTLTLFKAGRNIESHSSHIEDSIPKTVDSLLKTFGSVEVLPSRIIVFDGENSDKIAQEFISHQWSRGLSFLHMPQVSVLPAGFDGRAVVFGAAIQMGFAVAGGIVDHSEHDIKTLPSDGEVGSIKPTRRKHSEEEDEAKIDEAAHEKEKTKDTEDLDNKDEFPTSGDNFGFVIGQDIGTGVEKPEVTQAEDLKDDQEIIVDEPKIHQPVRHEAKVHEAYAVMPDERRPEREQDSDEDRDFSDQKRTGAKPALLGVIVGALKKISPPKLALSGLRGGSKMLIIPPILILLLIGGVLFYIFKLQATVTLHVAPKTQEESQTITFSADEDNDFSNSIIKATAVSTTLDGEASVDTTGKKETGEKSKGNVTIYNNSESKKTLPAGTVIVSSNDLEFVLDKEVAIASGSGDVFSGTKPGTAQVAVTAKNIGNEYNLPSNTKFEVGGSTSQIAAKNESAFSGGSKKEVRVVSKKDIEKVTDALPKSLSEKAKSDLTEEISGGDTLLPDFTDITLSKKVFNKKEGEEAKTLTLKASATFEGLAYTNSDVTAFAKELLKDKVSDDQNLSDDRLSFEVIDVEDVSETELKAKLGIEAGILPKLKTDTIIENLKGKSFDDASKYLSELPQVTRSEIQLSPNIPLLPQILPRIDSNIHVVIDTDE